MFYRFQLLVIIKKMDIVKPKSSVLKVIDFYNNCNNFFFWFLSLRFLQQNTLMFSNFRLRRIIFLILGAFLCIPSAAKLSFNSVLGKVKPMSRCKIVGL